MSALPEAKEALEQAIITSNTTLQVVLGTWNVHMWQTRQRKPNLGMVLQSLKQTPVDILCLQEVTESQYLKSSNPPNKKIETIPKLKHSLQFNANNEKQSMDRMRGVFCLSQYPMEELRCTHNKKGVRSARACIVHRTMYPPPFRPYTAQARKKERKIQ